MDIAVVLLTVTLYMLPFGFFQLFSGVLSDHYGKSRIILFGCILYSIGALGCVFSPNIDLLIISRFFQGCGIAFVYPIAFALGGDIAEPNEKKTIIGRLMAADQIGMLLGPPIAGFLIMFNWRFVFLLMAFFSIISIIFNWKLRVPRAMNQSGTMQILIRKMLTIGKNRSLQLLCFVSFVFSLSQNGIRDFLGDTLYTDPFCLKGYQIGLIFAAATLGGIIATQTVPRLSDRIGMKKTYVFGLSTVLLGNLLYAFSSSFYEFVLSAIIWGHGLTTVSLPLQVTLVDVLPSSSGAASSLFLGFRFTAFALSPILFSPVYSSAGIDIVILACSVLLIICSIPIQLFPKRAQPHPTIRENSGD